MAAELRDAVPSKQVKLDIRPNSGCLKYPLLILPAVCEVADDRSRPDSLAGQYGVDITVATSIKINSNDVWEDSLHNRNMFLFRIPLRFWQSTWKCSSCHQAQQLKGSLTESILHMSCNLRTNALDTTTCTCSHTPISKISIPIIAQCTTHAL